MCGIAGIVRLGDKDIHLPEAVKRLTDTIQHRGPDGEGFAFFSGNNIKTAGSDATPKAVWETVQPSQPKHQLEELTTKFDVALGHRRLSIIDLSPAGHQPMCTNDKNVWITYNGEIYNYIELREDLKQKGHTFRTDTDVEVVLKAYLEWGYNCTERFNGMWAFVIYDRPKNVIWGSRDRTGVKPFYYHQSNKLFAFASEQKAILELPGFERALNHKAVFDFFVFHKLESEPEGLIKGIIELQPSHSFELNPKTGDIRIWRYYEPTFDTDTLRFNEPEYQRHTKAIKELLINAVSLRLRSDVPIGSCLSGGIDSSSIVCIIHQLLQDSSFKQIGQQQKVFTSAFKQKDIDESHWAEVVVKHTNATWKKVFTDSNGLLNDLETLIYCQDIPLRSTSSYAQFALMRLASENGVKVVLDGQGADELFAGYSQHHTALWNHLFRTLRWNKLNQRMKQFEFELPAHKLMFRNYGKYILEKRLPTSLRSYAQQKYFHELKYIEPGFLESYKHLFNRDRHTYASSLNKMLEYEYFNGPLKELLKCEDRSSMWFSLESRTAFADDLPLMNYLCSVPSIYKLNKGRSKSLLRDAMKGILPDKIRHRKDKMGFLTPNNQWIAETHQQLRHYFEADTSGILNTSLLLKDFDQFFQPEAHQENYRIFKFISFAIWLKVFGIQ